MKILAYLLAGSLCWLPPCLAQEDTEEEFAAVPEPPDLPDPLESGQTIEPEVVIVRRGGQVVEEYRINGNLYMVKITPAAGRPYYLIDRNGDGSMETRINEDYEKLTVPQWVLFEW